MLTILENIHNKYNANFIIYRGIIHRDLKPENILVGKEKESNLLYLVDYGISK